MVQISTSILLATMAAVPLATFAAPVVESMQEHAQVPLNDAVDHDSTVHHSSHRSSSGEGHSAHSTHVKTATHLHHDKPVPQASLDGERLPRAFTEGQIKGMKSGWNLVKELGGHLGKGVMVGATLGPVLPHKSQPPPPQNQQPNQNARRSFNEGVVDLDARLSPGVVAEAKMLGGPAIRKVAGYAAKALGLAGATAFAYNMPQQRDLAELEGRDDEFGFSSDLVAREDVPEGITARDIEELEELIARDPLKFGSILKGIGRIAGTFIRRELELKAREYGSPSSLDDLD
ncbi:hypothetical protein CVT24_000188 [Panaeolus cyanescens]|uniref:Uncharacterized protein n=1 Tax=Panaeolus cyanescens TaxID=181874 RepID=A0A409W393_9AGAR|nr:hypothetical protein CVT24_000188 [Panaeolus cyanescens]